MDIVINVCWFGLLIFISLLVGILILYSAYKSKLSTIKDIHNKDKDVEITSEAFNRIGEVKKGTPNELILNLQNIENNKEIYSLYQRIEELEIQIEKMQEEQDKLIVDYAVMKSRLDVLTSTVGGKNVLN